MNLFVDLPGSSQLLTLLHWNYSVVFICSFIRKPISLRFAGLLNPCGVDIAFKSLVNRGHRGKMAPMNLRRKEISSKGTLKNQEQNRRQHWPSSSHRALEWVDLKRKEAVKPRTETQWLCTVQRWTDTAVAPQTMQLCWSQLLYTAVEPLLNTCQVLIRLYPFIHWGLPLCQPLPPFQQHTTLTLGFGYWVHLM